jgi:phytoene dehydrogenase-like protein
MFEFVYKMFGEGYATIPNNGIGAIPQQLRRKLKKTKFEFDTTVSRVDPQQIVLESGDTRLHEGVIIAAEAHGLIENLREPPTSWKSCYCLYFEVDKTNIPRDTIALISDPNALANNLYSYRESDTGKQILSATVVVPYEGSPEELRLQVEKEILRYSGCTKVTFIHTFHIPQALPDADQLRMDAEPSESEVLPNVYLAGDYLFNGSLNAAMQSGRLAAEAIIRKQQGWDG